MRALLELLVTQATLELQVITELVELVLLVLQEQRAEALQVTTAQRVDQVILAQQVDQET